MAKLMNLVYEVIAENVVEAGAEPQKEFNIWKIIFPDGMTHYTRTKPSTNSSEQAVKSFIGAESMSTNPRTPEAVQFWQLKKQNKLNLLKAQKIGTYPSQDAADAARRDAISKDSNAWQNPNKIGGAKGSGDKSTIKFPIDVPKSAIMRTKGPDGDKIYIKQAYLQQPDVPSQLKTVVGQTIDRTDMKGNPIKLRLVVKPEKINIV